MVEPQQIARPLGPVPRLLALESVWYGHCENAVVLRTFFDLLKNLENELVHGRTNFSKPAHL
jgi:hypothetical protein